MVYKVTRAKPFENPFRDFKGEVYKRLIDNELVCSRESAQIRKYVYVFIQNGYPIVVNMKENITHIIMSGH